LTASLAVPNERGRDEEFELLCKRKKKKRGRCDKAKSNCPVKCGRPYVIKAERMRVLDTTSSWVAVTYKPERAGERVRERRTEATKTQSHKKEQKRDQTQTTRGAKETGE
jgi:hypothetical protein